MLVLHPPVQVLSAPLFEWVGYGFVKVLAEDVQILYFSFFASSVQIYASE